MRTSKLTTTEIRELYDLALAYVSVSPYQLSTKIEDFTIARAQVMPSAADPVSVSDMGKLIISREAKRRPIKRGAGMVIRCTGWVAMTPEEVAREKWRPTHSKLVAIQENGKLTIKCHSHRACREALELLRRHYILDTLAKVRAS